jgi:hypothetical protein
VPSPSLRGLDGATVRIVDAGPLRAWVSDLTEGAASVTIERARAHDAVVRAALDVETPLPARFGQILASDDALRQSLDARRTELLRALERVRGAVEMTVRVLLQPSDAPAAMAPAGASGREYLAWLRERQRWERMVQAQADFLHKRIAEAVLGMVREEARALARPSAHLLSVSHLVPRDAVHSYRLALRALIDSEPLLRIMVSGPWAPYSFAELLGA